MGKTKKHVLHNFILEIKNNGTIYLLALPGMLLLFFFNYLPMIGIIISFKNFNFSDGIFKSPWAEPIYNNFIYLFTSEQTFRATRNTLLLNLIFMITGTIAAVVLALLLNEIKGNKFRKLSQSCTFLPYFMSWIIVSVFAYSLFTYDTGALNNILGKFGIPKVDWYSSSGLWPIIMSIIAIWKNAGYNAVLYLATLTGIDSTYYEAAEIDGASRFRRIWHISIPMLVPTIIVLNLLAIGRIMNADFGFFYGIIGDNSALFPTTDVLDTLIFRNLRQLGDVGMASAAGFYQSVIAFILVLASNKLADRYEKGSSLF